MTPQKKTTPQNKASAPARVAASLRPITQLVRPLVRKILPQKSVIFQQLFDHWPEIVAGTEAAGTIPEKLTFPHQQQKDGVLAVWARSSAQATEMTYNRQALIQRLNSVFGYALVRDIKVTAFPGAATPGVKKPNLAKVNSARGIPSQSLDKILGGISNPTLRTLLGELGAVLDQPAQADTHNDTHKGDPHA